MRARSSLSRGAGEGAERSEAGEGFLRGIGMQQRHLIFLAAATVVLVAAAIFALASGDRGISRAAPGERAFPALAANLGEVASVAVTRNGSTLTMIRDGEGWLV